MKFNFSRPNLQRTVDKEGGEGGRGDEKTAKNRSSHFQRRMTPPSVAAPGDTNLSDATGQKYKTGKIDTSIC